MEQKFVILGGHCLICGDELGSGRKSVLESSEYSDKQLYEFLESFVGEKFDELICSPATPAEICMKCFGTVEEYDRICLQAAQIQESLAKSFRDNQSYIHELSSDLLKCSDCLMEFSSSEGLQDHECIQLIETKIETAYINDSADDLEDEPLNMSQSASVPNPFKFTCNTCHEKFGKRKEYQNHVKRAHLPIEADTYECGKCYSRFISENDLLLHTTIAHPRDPHSTAFPCPLCFKTFGTKTLLNRHFGIHSADTERPHICELCGKNFFHYSSFIEHSKIHNDSREYHCGMPLTDHSVCTKSFRSQSHLNRHIKTHTKEKRHGCEHCGARFTERYNLTAHMNTHWGISRKSRNQESSNLNKVLLPMKRHDAAFSYDRPTVVFE